MTNYSRDPFQELQRNRERGYVGVRIQQGVPLLDRDLNLLAELVSSSVREILARHLGSGVAESNDAFAVQAVPAENDFRVAAPEGGGACLVAGIQVEIGRPLRYGEQPDVAPLSTPATHRRDLVYLDVWVEEVDAARDDALANAADVGVQTSVRLRPAWQVRVAEGADRAPVAMPGHAHYALAALERPGGVAMIQGQMIVDLRCTGLDLSELARRVQRMEAALFATIPEPVPGVGHDRAGWPRRNGGDAIRPLPAPGNRRSA
jgi:hypothetical protein